MSVARPETIAMSNESTGFDARLLVVPVLLCIWVLTFSTFSPPEDWKASRFGTSSILPPSVLKLIKLVGRGSAIGIVSFSLLSVWRHPKRRYAIRAMLPLILFTVFAIISVGWSALRTTSLMQAGTFGLLMMLATFVAIIWSNDDDSERVISHLGVALIVLSLVLIALHFGMPRAGVLTKESAGVLHSTNASASAGLGIVLTMAVRILWNSPWSRWWLPIIAIHLATMLIGGNRLSVAVTVFVSVVFLAFHLHRGAMAIVVFLLSTVGILYLIVDPSLTLVETGGKRLGVFAKQGQSSSELGSLSGRAEMWDKMWKSFKKSPLVGHGYFVTSPTGRIYVWNEWGNWTAHNCWLQVLTTTGSIGMGLLTCGLAWLALGVARAATILQDVSKSIWVVGTISLWIFGWAFLNSSFIGPLQPESVVFAVIVGIAAGLGATSAATIDDARRSADSIAAEGAIA